MWAIWLLKRQKNETKNDEELFILILNNSYGSFVLINAWGLVVPLGNRRAGRMWKYVHDCDIKRALYWQLEQGWSVTPTTCGWSVMTWQPLVYRLPISLGHLRSLPSFSSTGATTNATVRTRLWLPSPSTLHTQCSGESWGGRTGL
jgi:hypothetical protein